MRKTRKTRFDRNVNSPYFKANLSFGNGIFFTTEEIEIDKYLNDQNINYIKDNDVCDELLYGSEDEDESIIDEQEIKFKSYRNMESKKTFLPDLKLNRSSLMMRRKTLKVLNK